jgi:alpha-amylase/alpha-mannosidase (GH57 family)
MVEAVVVLSPNEVTVTRMKADFFAERCSNAYSENEFEFTNVLEEVCTKVSVHVALASLSVAH